jgi:hypothetical protein
MRREPNSGLAGRDGDVDSKVSVVGEELRDRGVEDEAVRVHDGRGDALVDRPRRRFPRQAPTVTVEFEPEILFRFISPISNYTRLADR